MRIRHLVAALAVTALFGGTAQAAVIAGWDFSQYAFAGNLFFDDEAGADYPGANTLGANYSNLVVNNVGPAAAAYGSLSFNGSNGSSSVTPVGDASEVFLPVAGSLAGNALGIAPNPFDSHVLLGAAGQDATNFLAMAATGIVKVVFAADLSSDPQQGMNWTLSFGAKTFAGNSEILIEYSTDNGANWLTAPAAQLSTDDTPYTRALASATADRLLVRFNLLGDQVIDNVAISADLVPEPLTSSLLATGLAGLALFGRRRA